jgi:hypothetical protein
MDAAKDMYANELHESGSSETSTSGNLLSCRIREDAITKHHPCRMAPTQLCIQAVVRLAGPTTARLNSRT